MPTYQYACTECGNQLEAVQAFTDEALTVCPECQGRLRKLYSAVGIVFKGSGFYRTDSRSGSADSAKEGAGKEGAGKEAAGKDGGSKDGGSKDSGSKDGGGGKESTGTKETASPSTGTAKETSTSTKQTAAATAKA